MDDDRSHSVASSRSEEEKTTLFICESCGHQQELKPNSPTPEIDAAVRVAEIRRGLRRGSEKPDEDSDTESVVSVSLNPIEEIPLIHSPFSKSAFIQPPPRWQGPRNVAADRDGQFKWEKPHGVDDTENETPAQRIRRLEQTVSEKQEDLDALGRQFARAQRENYTLAEEIRAFKGEHYDDLKADNVQLKEVNGRVFRENMMLRAEMKRMTNSRVRENEEKRVLEERYGVKARRPRNQKNNK